MKKKKGLIFGYALGVYVGDSYDAVLASEFKVDKASAEIKLNTQHVSKTLVRVWPADQDNSGAYQALLDFNEKYDADDLQPVLIEVEIAEADIKNRGFDDAQNQWFDVSVLMILETCD